MTAASELMTRVDTAWLRMDSRRNLMMINGVWLLRPALAYEALRERLQTKLLGCYPRFRQRVERQALLAYWVEDQDFRIERHLLSEQLPRRRGQSERAALQAFAGELASQPLDPAHPLWQMHLIEHYEGDGSAVIVRLHHCIADGIALNAVLMSIMDGGIDLRPPEARPAPPLSDAEWLDKALLRPATELAVKGIGLWGDGMAKALGYLAHPQQALGDSAELLGQGAQLLRDAGALALLPDDSKTLLKGSLSGAKRVAWCEPLPLPAVKAAAKAMNCSVNDVLLCCVAGAFGSWLRERGEDPGGKQIRAMVPVNLRPLEQARRLGNYFGLVPLVLPIGSANPVERLYEVRARMRDLKRNFQPLLAYGLLTISGLLTRPLQKALAQVFLRKTTAVMSNVKGPTRPVRICGSTLRQSIFWVPASGNVGLGVSVISYAGGVQFGLIADTLRCPDPQAVAERFGPEFEALLKLTRALPQASV